MADNNYQYTVGSLIEQLNKYDSDKVVYLASDEQLTTIYNGIGIGIHNTDNIVIYGCENYEVDE